ncbi:MAG TPA: universal stress protein [Desulfomonilaceae bacterium]|nr:universal stress protein [Desulfomonilaceae bacterium]
MTPRRILLCTDFSENSVPAREHAINFAVAFHASLSILHVVNSSRLGFPAFEVGVPFDLQEILKGIEESVRKAFEVMVKDCSAVEEVKTFSRIGVPANEIVRFAQEESIDLIVMGTHGWTGFRHLILGSTAENVVRTATCPVLTVKSSSEEPEPLGGA